MIGKNLWFVKIYHSYIIIIKTTSPVQGIYTLADFCNPLYFFQFLALIAVGIGLLFMLIFHVGVREKPRLSAFKAHKESKRNAGNWKLWFKDMQFYKVKHSFVKFFSFMYLLIFI